jgi:phosphotransferase system HPr (HPr) family protein
MPELTLEIKNEVGLHARPAALFVQTAGKFKSAITVQNGAVSANAKSILHVLTLGAENGAVITVVAEGEDADDALKALKELVENNFGEKG